MNWCGAEQSAKLQSAMTKILLVGMFTAIGIAVFKGSPSNVTPIFHASSGTPSFLYGFLMVLVMTPFFYAGFDTIPQQAEEAAEGTDYKKFGAIIGLALVNWRGNMDTGSERRSALLPGGNQSSSRGSFHD